MKEDKYQEENTQLRLMFLQRQKRLAVCQKSQIPDPNIVRNKQIVHIQQQSKQSLSNNKIRLNSIIYDKRPTNLKRNKITLSSLLHEDVDIFHRQPYSVNVQSLMITTFGFQTEVFLPILSKGLPMFIFNRDDQRPGQVLRKYSGFQNLAVISPPKSNTGYGVFHTKLWLVKFKTFLRVIVGTGNNHLMDWTVWQNAYWYHDCPLIQEKDISKQLKTEPIVNNQSGWGQIKDFNYEKDFINTLKRVITDMNPKNFDILKEMRLDLDKYSFVGIDVVLIPSFPGRFKGQEMQLVGLAKVRKIMRQHKKRFTKATLTCNSTSLGKLDQKIIREVYFAFNPWVNQFNVKNFQLVYPTESYVKNQTCGEAGVLFLTKENYEKCELKKEIFYRYEESAQNGVLGGIPHLKTIIIEEQGEEEKCVFYLGSHNLTRAAWGSYQKNESQINCSNSELGLLFLGYKKAELKYWLPYKWPANKYTKEDTPFIRCFNQ